MRKIITALIVSFIFSFLISTHIYAAPTTREISVYLYQDYSDCTFIISWENTEKTASVRLATPDGRVISATSQNSEAFSGSMMINVGNAESGYWRAYVTGDNLGSISVSGGSTASSVKQNPIQNFTAEISGNKIRFSWSINSTQSRINIDIYADYGEYYGNYSVLWNHSTSKKSFVDVDLDELQTGFCNFSISYRDENYNQHTLSMDEPIYIVQPNAPEKLKNIRVGSVDGAMYATWDPTSYGYYYVTLYDYDTMGAVYYETVYTNFYRINYDSDRIKLTVAAIDENYVYGEAEVYEIVKQEPEGYVSFPDYSVTRDSTVKINVSCSSDGSAGVYLDGKLLLDDAGNGNYEIVLSEGRHDITAFVADKYGNMKTFSKEMTVDITSPLLNIDSGDDTVSHSDSFLLSGTAEPGAVIAINGVEQETASGSFSAKVQLTKDSNLITVTAYDAAGNKSVRSINVVYANKSFDWAVFILPIILCGLLTCWYTYLNHKGRKEPSDEKGE